MRLLHTVTTSLPQDSQTALEENVSAWQHARDRDIATSMTDTPTSLPLGPGEYDEPLGLDLVVICQNALAVETLEKERGYREAHFDYILQFLRTVLLKHGAGLIYTMPNQPGQLQPLIHSLLDISSVPVTGKEKSERSLKHNVVDRERVLVPPAWDSWGKIRVLREGFDVEGISRAWSVEIQTPSPSLSTNPIPSASDAEANDAVAGASAEPGSTENEQEEENSTVALYEQRIQDPYPGNTTPPRLEIECTPDQAFLFTQSERLEAYRAEDETAKKTREAQRATRPGGASGASLPNPAGSSEEGARAMAEHVGPVQFNMGGIQYDAEDVLRRLKVCNPPRLRLATHLCSSQEILIHIARNARNLRRRRRRQQRLRRRTADARQGKPRPSHPTPHPLPERVRVKATSRPRTSRRILLV